jgi:hypothetical protein
MPHGSKIKADTQTDKVPRLIPFILGVTGHRDLRPEDLPHLEAAVRKVFDEVKQACPLTPVLVLSALAEGADRLVARVGLESGARLAVPLPFDREEYVKDFATAESRMEFAQLLVRAETWFVLPHAEGDTAANNHLPGQHREEKYAAAGIYIARHSHLLLALWDGNLKAKSGGTSHIVQLRLGGVPARHERLGEALHVLDDGPVYHIVTPRRTKPQPVDEPFALRRLSPQSHHHTHPGARENERETKVTRDQPELPEGSQNLEAFNRDTLALMPRLLSTVRRSRETLIPTEKLAHLSTTTRRLLEHYALANALAIHFQTRRRRAWIALCGLGVLAVISLAGDNLAGEEGPVRHGLFLAGYLVMVALGFGAFKLAEGRAWQSKHLDYRVLAEGFRVQLFWSLAGIEEDVAEHYLSKQRSELEWIRQAIRSSNFPPRSDSSPLTGTRLNWENLRLAGLYWINDQRGYFTETKQSNDATLLFRRRLAKALLFTALLFVFIMAVIDLFAPAGAGRGLGKWFSNTLGAGSAILLALAGAFEVYAEKMALSEQTKQYEQMAQVFTLAAKRFEQCLAKSDREGALRLLFALGREALTENEDWVLLHRERTFEVRLG